MKRLLLRAAGPRRVRLGVLGVAAGMTPWIAGAWGPPVGDVNEAARVSVKRGDPATRDRRPDPAAELKAVLDEHVEWLLEQDPIEGVRRGNARFAGRLRDESPEAYTRRLTDVTLRLEKLLRVETAGLPQNDRDTARLLEYELVQSIEGSRFHSEQRPIDSRNGPQIWLPQISISLPLRTPEQFRSYVKLLEAMPKYLDQTMEEMRLGLAAGRTPPRVCAEGADEQAAALVVKNEAEAAGSPFYAPFAGSGGGDQESAARARKVIVEQVSPAFAKLAAFLKDEYIPRCRESIGASASVDGAAWYEFELRAHTTLAMTAEEIHQTGLDEVKRIRAEMFRVIARTDFARKEELKGDALFAAFTKYLRSDPRFYYTSEEELLRDYRALCKGVDAQLPRLFAVLPRNAYGVKAMPALGAESSPSAYYYPGSLKGGVPGYFIVNTSRLDQRPRYEMRALALHESVPGHHLQIALSQELEGLHEFRTFAGYSAFVEGWGLYAERLGREMEPAVGVAAAGSGAKESPSGVESDEGLGQGIYADPYDDFGRLSFEMWRACRLVVDTGIHAKGWTRRQAVDFMTSNTALSAANIQSEVDRYIGWPGQACAYKLGEIEIRGIRREAEDSLGAAFDLREFHRALLGGGALPLPVLRERMSRWIGGGGKFPEEGASGG